jgi:nicotinate-nucleotide pyrophosphorylase (carboxylating)
VARQNLVVSGGPVVRLVFRALDPGLSYEPGAGEGSVLEQGACVGVVRGDSRAILRGERTALNFLMRMCGIATATRDAVREIAGTTARILDTRKTAPGLRLLDKYAVTCGGGRNHRMGLWDGVLVKDTHLGAGLSIAEAVHRARTARGAGGEVIVEVRTLDELRQAIAAGASRALLDNMDLATMREAVRCGAGRIELEASGGLRPGSLRAVAETGVDYLSVGWLTHSAPAADLSMSLTRG